MSCIQILKIANLAVIQPRRERDKNLNYYTLRICLLGRISIFLNFNYNGGKSIKLIYFIVIEKFI